MKPYRQITGPPEAVVLPVITASIHELLGLAIPDGAGDVNVLDVGCGTQPLREVLRDRGYSYHSCDVRQNAAGAVDFVTSIDGPLPTGLLDLAPFALVLCTEVLEHVLDWNATFRNFTVLVRPGGYVLITCPFVYFPHERPHDYWRPTAHAVRAMAGRHGFQVVRAIESGSPWDVLRLVLESQLVFQQDARVSSRVTAIGVRRLCGLLRRICESTWVASRVTLSSEFYLNTAVLIQRDR